MKLLTRLRQFFCQHREQLTKTEDVSETQTRFYVECLRCGLESPGVILGVAMTRNDRRSHTSPNCSGRDCPGGIGCGIKWPAPPERCPIHKTPDCYCIRLGPVEAAREIETYKHWRTPITEGEPEAAVISQPYLWNCGGM